jgi:hypothetical protein
MARWRRDIPRGGSDIQRQKRRIILQRAVELIAQAHSTQ